MMKLEVLFTPAEFAALTRRDLSESCCVVFDVLRATSSMICALWNDATAILPVEEIHEALASKKEFPEALLAGEREGMRIGPGLTGGISFDLGNSPREFTPEVVKGKPIVMTTTNGTKALHACRKAKTTLAASFLNLDRISERILQFEPKELLLVCSGTLDQAAYEDALGAGALCDLLWARYDRGQVADSALIARELFLQSSGHLEESLARSRNARRLLSIPELRQDVGFCLRRDAFPLLAVLDKDGFVRRQT